MTKENISILREKTLYRKNVWHSTLQQFRVLKETLREIASFYQTELSGNNIEIEYKERSVYEAELKIGYDILIFSVQPYIFYFDRNHPAWRLSYLKQNRMNAFCGIINIYNFLADSIQKNRVDDLGYLIGRIFINQESYYFVEGKRQNEHAYHIFGTETITKEKIAAIVDTALQYTLDFDPLVPPYDSVKIISVDQILSKIETSAFPTAKRIGFEYRSDDV